jgi:hypothetical protein
MTKANTAATSFSRTPLFPYSGAALDIAVLVKRPRYRKLPATDSLMVVDSERTDQDSFREMPFERD